MIYTFNHKRVIIPDDFIIKNMRILELTKEEAIELWLEDNGFIKNEVVEELTAKAKENKVNHGAKSFKPRKKTERVRKPDVEKENVIEILSKALENAGFSPKITNKAKIIEFSIGENAYKLDLIKKRPPKK